ncbi:MAG: SDR family oxidoreductase [Burkholderiaceae bacterium]|jgi:NAD(P)-dependent dehydrogenase (short-subunit alcohol dehydrogenase family)|nr:SDR family oxidoreductase [Burkholderiaceae bacterium]
MPTVLIVGASRGIGREFARQYAADGARVIATHRQPDDAAALRALGARPVALDVLDAGAIAGLGRQLDGDLIDLVIVNAGVYGPRSSGLQAPGADEFDAVMHTNVRAPMQLIAALAPQLAATRGKLVVISSAMGSLGRMASASGWLYRASKAALNVALRAASVELGPQGVTCMTFHPGWVKTDMGGAEADLAPAEAVASLRRVIAAANASHNGKFLNYTGEQLPW